MYKFVTGFFLCALITTVHAKVITKEVTYMQGDTELVGYIAYDDNDKGKRPGILVVHEWWGHNEYVRDRVRQLAALGYVAFALDMYGDGKVANHPKDAARFSSQVKKNRQVAEARFDVAVKQLAQLKVTDAGNIAAIGYCFGGGVVLDMARRGKALKGVVSFHGSLGTDTPAVKDKVKAKILVFNGAADVFVKKATITRFRQEMNSANANLTFVSFVDAKHSFTNPEATRMGKKFGLPLEYNPKADKVSWQQMKVFLKGVFKPAIN